MINYLDTWRRHKLAAFCEESAKIEGEPVGKTDLAAAHFALGMDRITIENILEIHRIMCEPLKVDWAGKWRTCNVRVGNYVAPPHEMVPSMMNAFVKESAKLDSWVLHNRFEKAHPFSDRNGRVGRLLWLHKAIREGHDFKLSFLHAYYYQSLDHQ